MSHKDLHRYIWVTKKNREIGSKKPGWIQFRVDDSSFPESNRISDRSAEKYLAKLETQIGHAFAVDGRRIGGYGRIFASVRSAAV